MGRTWSDLVPIEASLTRQSHDGYQLVHPDGKRIFVFYGYNFGSLTYPRKKGGKGHIDLARSDMQLKEGYFVKLSVDGGRSFNAERAVIPVRRSKIDRENPFNGSIMGMFCCDKPSIIGESVYFAFQKTKEGGGETHGSEVFFMRSRDFLRVESPRDATWETLPEGDVGLQAPKGAFMLGEEPHVMQADSCDPHRLFCLWRCEVGRIACSYSSDGGRIWTTPYMMTYTGNDDGSREVRNPRGSITPFKLKETTSDGRAMFILIFYNNGHTEREGYVGRRCYWFILGTESQSKPKTIAWSQPELALWWDGESLADRPGWNADWAIVDGPGYPDFVQIEDSNDLYYVESNKLTVRFHHVPRRLKYMLTIQDRICSKPHGNPVFSSINPRPGTNARGPILSELRSRSGGFTIAIWFRSKGDVSPREILVSALSSVTATLDEKSDGRRILKGYTVAVVGDGHEGCQLELRVTDGFGRTFSQRTDSCAGTVRLFDGGTHMCCFIADAAPRLHSVVVDDQLCNGGLSRPQGWGIIPENIDDVGGQEISIQPEPTVLRPYPRFRGDLLGLEIYDRPLLTTEAIGYYRYMNEGARS
eukprot:g2717.t1